MFDNNVKIPLSCPECGNQWSESLGTLRTKSPVTCPACRRYEVDTTEFAKTMSGVERKLKGFGR